MIIRLAPAMLRATVPLAGKMSTAVKASRQFSSSKEKKAENRVFNPVRFPHDLESYINLSSSSHTPLITLWTASYCQTCHHISPLLTSLINSGVGEAEGGVSFCEVEYDSPDIMESGFGMRYMITSMPTLLGFDRGEAMTDTRVVDARKLGNRDEMTEWIKNEARRGGSGGGGGGWNNFPRGGELFGGLFGVTK